MPKAEPAPEPEPEAAPAARAADPAPAVEAEPEPAAPEPAAAAPEPEPEPVAPAPEVPKRETPLGEPDAAAVRQLWSTVREKVRERNKVIDVMLAGATVLAVDGDTLVLAHESAPLSKRIVEQRNAEVIRDALKDALGVNWKVRCESGGPAVAPAAAVPVEPVPAEPAPDPVEVQRAEEDELIAEAVRDGEDPAPRRDPEEVALEILQTELGARKIDG